MKKILSIILVTIIMFFSTICVYADAESFASNSISSINDSLILPKGGADIKLSVPLYRQPFNSDLCGPTCCRMILKYYGVSKNLDAIANEMQNMPNHNYTHIDSVTTMLNRYISGNHYLKKSDSAYPFPSNLVASIDAGYPIVCHVNTAVLPEYNGAIFYHYVVATGYFWAQGGSSGGTENVYYNDPHYNDDYGGRHQCSWFKMQKAIQNHMGLYVRGI